MKVTIENIDGVLHTVVWRDENDSLKNFYSRELFSCLAMFDGDRDYHIATALPSLPRNPTDNDVELLYLYAAHGLYPSCTFDDGEVTVWAGHIRGSQHIDKTMIEWQTPLIDYATDKEGNRIEIALRD